MAMFQIVVQLCQNQVMEMVNSDALVPLNDTIKTIGEDKFNGNSIR